MKLNDLSVLCEELKNIMCGQEKLKVKYKKDLFYNNLNRSILQMQQFIKHYKLNEQGIELEPDGTSGIDFICPELEIKNGEQKAQWPKNKSLTEKGLGELKFDKQNDPIRRIQTLEYDAFMYSCMKRSGDIVFSLIIIGRKNAELLNPLIEKHQSVKIKEIKLYESIGKRIPRDDIGIPVYKST